jgi:hypothetical protein
MEARWGPICFSITSSDSNQAFVSVVSWEANPDDSDCRFDDAVLTGDPERVAWFTLI